MQYSISDLEKLSGVSVHNIRMWERRYAALQPSRTAGNTRFYDDDHLKRLLCITALYHAGHKISQACGLSNEEMFALLQKQTDRTLSAKHRFEYVISQIINHGLAYNEEKINVLISASFELNGVLDTYKYVIHPMLVRMGLMWLDESLCPSQEHFLSSIIRQKLLAAIDALGGNPHPHASSWLLFLPEDEDHDIGLLLASYLLRAAGHQVIYLGAKVPLFALSKTAEITKPRNMLLFLTRIRPLTHAQAYINRLSTELPVANIYLSGNDKVLSGINYPAGTNRLKTLYDFEQVILYS